MSNIDRHEEHKEITIPVTGPDDKKGRQEENRAVETKEISEASNADYLDHLQRLKAEFSNYRKRVEKERETLFLVAKGELVSRLLSVMDDFERMIRHHGQKNQCSIAGVHLIYQKFKKILVDEGLKEIPSVGEMFNPEFHEAVSVEETDEEKQGIIVEEWEKGYRFGEKLLRPSRVKVGKYVEKRVNNYYGG